MWIAVINNLPELFGFACSGAFGFVAGVRVGKWQAKRKSNAA